MKMHILGTCAGTEPMPNRKHVSFAIERDGNVYWFDAGEGCSYTAHLMGVDLLSVRSIFISHPHMDHVGGLGNLLWNIRKLDGLSGAKLEGKDIEVYMPNMDTWNGLMQLLKNTEGGFQCSFDLKASRITDGVIYDSDGIKVTALHNLHMVKTDDGRWQSFSFLIEADGKRIVYSGDIKSMEDISTLIESCDMLLIETGHHSVEDICKYIKDENKDVDKLVFIHNGRGILNDPIGELNRAKEIFGDNVLISEDGMTIDL